MAKHRIGLSVAQLLEEARARRVRPYVQHVQLSPGRWTWTGGLYDDLNPGRKTMAKQQGPSEKDLATLRAAAVERAKQGNNEGAAGLAAIHDLVTGELGEPGENTQQ